MFYCRSWLWQRKIFYTDWKKKKKIPEFPVRLNIKITQVIIINLISSLNGNFPWVSLRIQRLEFPLRTRLICTAICSDMFGLVFLGTNLVHVECDRVGVIKKVCTHGVYLKQKYSKVLILISWQTLMAPLQSCLRILLCRALKANKKKIKSKKHLQNGWFCKHLIAKDSWANDNIWHSPNRPICRKMCFVILWPRDMFFQFFKHTKKKLFFCTFTKSLIIFFLPSSFILLHVIFLCLKTFFYIFIKPVNEDFIFPSKVPKYIFEKWYHLNHLDVSMQLYETFDIIEWYQSESFMIKLLARPFNWRALFIVHHQIIRFHTLRTIDFVSFFGALCSGFDW